MTTPSTPRTSHEQQVERLSEAQKSTGRQDLIAPPPTTEQSDPVHIDIRRGERIWLGFTLVGTLFVAVIVYFIITR